jgi:Zn finger protein HypA/HybF involved in hydrogenase expression
VKVGRASGIMNDALVFAFEALREGSVAHLGQDKQYEPLFLLVLSTNCVAVL